MIPVVKKKFYKIQLTFHHNRDSLFQTLEYQHPNEKLASRNQIK